MFCLRVTTSGAEDLDHVRSVSSRAAFRPFDLALARSTGPARHCPVASARRRGQGRLRLSGEQPRAAANERGCVKSFTRLCTLDRPFSLFTEAPYFFTRPRVDFYTVLEVEIQQTNLPSGLDQQTVLTHVQRSGRKRSHTRSIELVRTFIGHKPD